MATEYRLEYRYGDGRWQTTTMDRCVWTDKGRAVRALVFEADGASGTPWQYRLASREVTEWEPIENADLVELHESHPQPSAPSGGCVTEVIGPE